VDLPRRETGEAQQSCCAPGDRRPNWRQVKSVHHPRRAPLPGGHTPRPASPLPRVAAARCYAASDACRPPARVKSDPEVLWAGATRPVQRPAQQEQSSASGVAPSACRARPHRSTERRSRRRACAWAPFAPLPALICAASALCQTHRRPSRAALPDRPIREPAAPAGLLLYMKTINSGS